MSQSSSNTGQLVFQKELFDAQMGFSSLVNSLSNCIFPVRTQFCFVHLTIQEFVAETLASNTIVKFIPIISITIKAFGTAVSCRSLRRKKQDVW